MDERGSPVLRGALLNVPLPNRPTFEDFRVLARLARQKVVSRFVHPEPVSKLRTYDINGVKLRIADYSTSMAPDIDYFELRNDEYGLDAIDFAPGDVVIDIGGNVGQVAIYLAKRYPAVRIFSFEPVPENHDHYRRNLESNDVTNVHLSNLAVTGDGRDLSLTVNFDNNSGGGTAHVRDMEMPRHRSCTAKSVTLDQLFVEHGIEKCKLLKIDCEGSEHEILRNTTVLDRVEYLSGEFHINEQLAMRGYSIEALQHHCERFIQPSKIRVKRCHMAE